MQTEFQGDPSDFDLHGLVGLRVLGAAPGDLAAVERQIGLPRTLLQRAPDIIIRFVDRLQVSTPVRFLGLQDVGFTDDAFLVLRSKHRTGVRIRIPFRDIGRQCEIVCESGVPAVPFLIPIINLTMLKRGALPLHASAFVYDGLGVLCTGWSKGGKTETLLGFMARGARYVGDEWVYISRDGRQLYGLPEPIRLWDWHLRSQPHWRSCVGVRRRARLRLLATAHTLVEWSPLRSLDPLRRLLERQRYVDIAPHQLFGTAACALAGPFDRLVFVVSHETADVTPCPVDPQDVARRMRFSLSFERREFDAMYRMFRFAFPEMENPLIEAADELLLAALEQAFEGKLACELQHPYPVSIPQLFDVLRPAICRSERAPRARSQVVSTLLEHSAAAGA